MIERKKTSYLDGQNSAVIEKYNQRAFRVRVEQTYKVLPLDGTTPLDRSRVVFNGSAKAALAWFNTRYGQRVVRGKHTQFSEAHATHLRERGFTVQLWLASDRLEPIEPHRAHKEESSAVKA